MSDPTETMSCFINTSLASGNDLGWYIMSNTADIQAKIQTQNFTTTTDEILLHSGDSSRAFFNTIQKCPNEITEDWKMSYVDAGISGLYNLQDEISVTITPVCVDSQATKTLTVTNVYGLSEQTTGCNKYGVSEEIIQQIRASYDDLFKTYKMSFDSLDDLAMAPGMYATIGFQISFLAVLWFKALIDLI